MNLSVYRKFYQLTIYLSLYTQTLYLSMCQNMAYFGLFLILPHGELGVDLLHEVEKSSATETTINVIINLLTMNNLAFIDGQNLHMGTVSSDIPWKINLKRFRVYLNKKYQVKQAYYFLGYTQDDNQELYENIQSAGFILMFKKHSPVMLGKKKGNVDTDIVFNVMKKLYQKEDFDKIVLASGDGDYKMLVDFLIEEKRFKKILFPNKKFASSLYNDLGSEYFDYLDSRDVKGKINHDI